MSKPLIVIADMDTAYLAELENKFLVELGDRADVTAYYSRMVVIFKVKSVPGSAVELFLPACKCRLHLFEIERSI